MKPTFNDIDNGIAPALLRFADGKDAAWRRATPQWSGGSDGSARGLQGEAPVCCLAISKNNSYLLAASGGKVSLHNLVTFKVRIV
jgi:hypothetical protein